MSNSDEMRYAVSANVYPGTFVTVRPCLEGDINGRSSFRIWEEQMLCLLDSHDVAGFVDGEIEPPIKEESEQLYKEWRRRDRLVKGWILGSIGKDALDAVWDQPTARSTWLELHRFFDTRDFEHDSENKNEVQNENESSAAAGGGDVDYSSRLALYKAAQRGDWDIAENIFKNKPELRTAKITPDSETALHVGVLSGRSIIFVKRLVELMPEEALAITDSFGKTALHNAAIVGNRLAAIALLMKNPNLLYVSSDGNNRRLPVLQAAINCRKFTLQYLIRKHEDNPSSLFEGRLGIQLLNEIIASQFVDIALHLVHRYPSLTLLTNEEDGTGTSALSSLIAATYTLFRRTESLLQKFVYHCIPVQRHQFEARPTTHATTHDIENLCGNCTAGHYDACFRNISIGELLSSTTVSFSLIHLLLAAIIQSIPFVHFI